MDDSTTSASPARVRARPFVMSRIGYVSAAVVVAGFAATALVMPHANAGAHFGMADQVATGVVGLILAGLCFMLTRPRLDADAHVVRTRGFLGGWRTVPWDVVVAVDFPSSVRFARLVLPAEETLAIYAVHRLDGTRAVETMRRLRALFAQARS